MHEVAASPVVRVALRMHDPCVRVRADCAPVLAQRHNGSECAAQSTVQAARTIQILLLVLRDVGAAAPARARVPLLIIGRVPLAGAPPRVPVAYPPHLHTRRLERDVNSTVLHRLEDRGPLYADVIACFLRRIQLALPFAQAPELPRLRGGRARRAAVLR